MKVIALCQVYNEEAFVHQALQWATQVCDQIIITEGCLTPFGNQTRRSQDNTRGIIEDYKKLYDRENKIRFFDAFIAEPAPANREQYEGMNKNFMLKKADIEHGDLIYILDVDEFWHKSRFQHIVDLFRQNDNLQHVPVEEYQFAYNCSLCFNASHDGRFMRYVNGARFGTTNHFIYPDGRDITKDYTYLQKREITQMCHFCWVKHPLLIKQKVESFRRPSFTTWYNNVYLQFPIIGEQVYSINQQIPPYFGKGFAEGQHSKLESFVGLLPEAISSVKIDWLDYIKNNQESLLIRRLS